MHTHEEGNYYELFFRQSTHFYLYRIQLEPCSFITLAVFPSTSCHINYGKVLNDPSAYRHIDLGVSFSNCYRLSLVKKSFTSQSVQSFQVVWLGAVRKGLLVESLDRITFCLSLWLEKSGTKSHRGKKKQLWNMSLWLSASIWIIQDVTIVNMTPRSTELHLTTGSVGKVLDFKSSHSCYKHVFIGAYICLDLLVTYGNDTKLCVVDHVYWLARGQTTVNNLILGWI